MPSAMRPGTEKWEPPAHAAEGAGDSNRSNEIQPGVGRVSDFTIRSALPLTDPSAIRQLQKIQLFLNGQLTVATLLEGIWDHRKPARHTTPGADHPHTGDAKDSHANGNGPQGTSGLPRRTPDIPSAPIHAAVPAAGTTPAVSALAQAAPKPEPVGSAPQPQPPTQSAEPGAQVPPPGPSLYTPQAEAQRVQEQPGPPQTPPPKPQTMPAEHSQIALLQVLQGSVYLQQQVVLLPVVPAPALLQPVVLQPVTAVPPTAVPAPDQPATAPTAPAELLPLQEQTGAAAVPSEALAAEVTAAKEAAALQQLTTALAALCPEPRKTLAGQHHELRLRAVLAVAMSQAWDELLTSPGAPAATAGPPGVDGGRGGTPEVFPRPQRVQVGRTLEQLDELFTRLFPPYIKGRPRMTAEPKFYEQLGHGIVELGLRNCPERRCGETVFIPGKDWGAQRVAVLTAIMSELGPLEELAAQLGQGQGQEGDREVQHAIGEAVAAGAPAKSRGPRDDPPPAGGRKRPAEGEAEGRRKQTVPPSSGPRRPPPPPLPPPQHPHPSSAPPESALPPPRPAPLHSGRGLPETDAANPPPEPCSGAATGGGLDTIHRPPPLQEITRIRLYLRARIGSLLCSRDPKPVPLEEIVEGVAAKARVALTQDFLAACGFATVESLMEGAFGETVELRRGPGDQVGVVPSERYRNERSKYNYGLHRAAGAAAAVSTAAAGTGAGGGAWDGTEQAREDGEGAGECGQELGQEPQHKRQRHGPGPDQARVARDHMRQGMAPHQPGLPEQPPAPPPPLTQHHQRHQQHQHQHPLAQQLQTQTQGDVAHPTPSHQYQHQLQPHQQQLERQPCRPTPRLEGRCSDMPAPSTSSGYSALPTPVEAAAAAAAAAAAGLQVSGQSCGSSATSMSGTRAAGWEPTGTGAVSKRVSALPAHLRPRQAGYRPPDPPEPAQQQQVHSQTQECGQQQQPSVEPAQARAGGVQPQPQDSREIEPGLASKRSSGDGGGCAYRGSAGGQGCDPEAATAAPAMVPAVQPWPGTTPVKVEPGLSEADADGQPLCRRPTACCEGGQRVELELWSARQAAALGAPAAVCQGSDACWRAAVMGDGQVLAAVWAVKETDAILSLMKLMEGLS